MNSPLKAPQKEKKGTNLIKFTNDHRPFAELRGDFSLVTQQRMSVLEGLNLRFDSKTGGIILKISVKLYSFF